MSLLLTECVDCDIMLPASAESCANGHRMCRGCIVNGIKYCTKEGAKFMCGEIDCGDFMDHSDIKKAVDPALFDDYDARLLAKALDVVPDIFRCAHCSNGAEIDPEDPEFYCETCEKTFCISCSKDFHPGKPCGSGIHESSESLTASFLKTFTILCTCGTHVERLDACAHLTCEKCSAEWCWVCKGPWTEHLDGMQTCPLYEEPIRDGAKAHFEKVADFDRVEDESVEPDLIRFIEDERIRVELVENERAEAESVRLAEVARAMVKNYVVACVMAGIRVMVTYLVETIAKIAYFKADHTRDEIYKTARRVVASIQATKMAYEAAEWVCDSSKEHLDAAKEDDEAAEEILYFALDKKRTTRKSFIMAKKLVVAANTIYHNEEPYSLVVHEALTAAYKARYVALNLVNQARREHDAARAAYRNAIDRRLDLDNQVKINLKDLNGAMKDCDTANLKGRAVRNKLRNL